MQLASLDGLDAVVEAVERSGRIARVEMLSALVCMVDGAVVAALVNDRQPEVSGREALTVMRSIFASIKSSNISRTVAVNSDFVTHF